jgi:hypothetical protein
MGRGRHRARSRKAVVAARAVVGGLALAEITGGFAAVPADAATPQPARHHHHGDDGSLPLGVRGPDGRGRYVCDQAHLYFAACNPNNLGQVVDYPVYDGYGKHAAPAAPQQAPAQQAQTTGPAPTPDPGPGPQFGLYVVRPGDTLTHIAATQQVPWEVLWALNGDCVPNPDVIFPGQLLRLPA